MDFKEELWHQGLGQGRTMRFQPLGGSMVPVLRQGDTITIAPGRQCRLGDIVLYRCEDGIVLHRVIYKRSGRVFTKGDALRHIDAPVLSQDILGRAVARERQGKVRRPDHLVARFLGLAWCLSFPWIPGLLAFLAAARLFLRNLDGLSTLARRPPDVL